MVEVAVAQQAKTKKSRKKSKPGPGKNSPGLNTKPRMTKATRGVVFLASSHFAPKEKP